MSLTPDQRLAIFEAARRREPDPGRQIVLSTDRDAKLLRQRPGEPDLRPVAHMDCPPGHVLVEWVGEQGPRAQEQILAAIRMGLLDARLVEMINQYQRLSATRIDGVSGRTVGEFESDGMSAIYTWGVRPGTYIRPLPFKDADRLFSTPAAHEFRYIENGVTTGFALDYIDRVLPPGLRATVRAIDVTLGREQKLVGMRAGPGRVGWWQ